MSTTSYFLYKKQVSYDGSNWYDVQPSVYSYDGDGTQTPVVKEAHDAFCGALPPIYRWVDTQDTICVEAQTKFSATYSDSTTYIIPCTSSSTLTSQEIKAHTTPYSSMTSAVIGSCVTRLGENAFEDCTNLSSVTIPSSLQRVDLNGFNTSGISDVYLEDLSSWCNVSMYAFWVSNPFYRADASNISQKLYINGVSVSSLTIPNDVTTINYGVFARCNAIKRLTIPSNVRTIGNSSFRGCPNLSSLTLNEGVEVISEDAFFETPLTSITIPNSVTAIYGGAFTHCEKVERIEIGSGLTTITYQANGNPFDVSPLNQSNKFRVLSSITVSPDNTHFEAVNNCLVETSTKKLVVGCKNSVIPNDIVEIGRDAFSHVSGLTSIQLPSTLANIGINAFIYCRDLTSVTIPSSVTEIHSDAFGFCDRINSVTILATTPPTLDGVSAFRPTSSLNNYPIYVPAQSVEAYKTANVWSEISSRIQAIP